MPVEVVVRISPRMFREDAAALRDWLDLNYPVGWVERADPARGDSLASGDLILAAVFTGVGEAIGKEAISIVRKKIQELAARYRHDEPPTAEVDELVQPEAEEPAAGEPEPCGPGDVGQ